MEKHSKNDNSSILRMEQQVTQLQDDISDIAVQQSDLNDKMVTIINMLKKNFRQESRRIKKNKNPDAPKQPMTSYFCFCASVRESIKTENPNCSMPEHSKIMGAKWKLLTETEKKPFITTASEDKERYNTEVLLFNEKLNI